MFQSFADTINIVQEVDPQSDTSTVRNGTSLDMTGWEGVFFILNIGAMTATGTVDFKVQSAAATSFGTPHDISGAALTQVLAASGGSKFYTIDVKAQTMLAAQSGDRYMRCVLTPATAASLVGVTAIQYRRNGALPVTANATQAVAV